MSSLMQRLSFGKLLGKMFNGSRDLYKVFGYSQFVTYEQAIGKYRRQDIASRIIDAPANALWSNPPKIKSSDEDWNAVWKELTQTKNLWNTISRADKMAGMGDFSVLLIGFDDGGTSLDRQVSALPGRKVLYLQPYSFAATDIKSLVQNTSSARYLKPETYTIKPALDPSTRANPQAITSALKSIKPINVHYSRVLHIAEHYMQDEVFGNPRLERVWNLLDDVLKVAGGTAETFWLAGNRGMQVDVDKEMELTPDDERDLNSEIEEYVHQLRRVIRTRGVKINNLGSDVPDPRNAFDMLLSLISGATGIPKRILLGSEMGQLASGQDRNNWAERIEERRKDFAEPVVIYPLIQMLTSAGVLPEADVTIEWPDAFKLTPLERAQTSAQTARSAANLSKAIDTNPELVKLEEARTILELDQTPETILISR